MALQSAPSGNRYAAGPSPSGLADVLDLILDKGLVIDLYVRVSLVGIELLTIDARIVVASVDTYLRFAEAVGRMNLEEADDSKGLPELMEDVTSGGAKSKTSGALEGVKDKFDEMFSSDDDDDSGDEDEEEDDGRLPRKNERRRERAPSRARRKRSDGDDE
jgi:hypothetical protein